MSTNHHNPIADDANLDHTTFNTIAAAIDSQMTDMDDGTHNYTNININRGTIDNVTIGGASPGPATFSDITATTNLWGPAWMVTMGGSTQDVTTITIATVEFDTEVLDSNSNFNTVTYTLTPTVEGWYYCAATILWSAAWNANKLMQLSIVGTNETSHTSKETKGANSEGLNVHGIHYCNGSSDTILVQVYNGDTTTRTLLGNAYNCWFQGWRIQ